MLLPGTKNENNGIYKINKEQDDFNENKQQITKNYNNYYLDRSEKESFAKGVRSKHSTSKQKSH